MFAPMHLNVYAFSALRPLVLKDPNGEDWTVGDVITAVFVPGKILAKPVEDSISEVMKAAPDLSRPFTATGVASGVVQGVAEQVEPPVVGAVTGNAIQEGSADIIPAKKNDVGIPLGKGLVRTAAAGLTFVGGGRAGPKEIPCVTGCFVAGTLVETENGDVPIEQLRVGDRVIAGSAQCAGDHLDPDARTFHLELPNPKRPGDVLKIELVRPRSWLTEHVHDGKVWFEIPELEAGGLASVAAISPAPKEKPGTGCLVLMTVEHAAGELLRLHLDDGKSIELTPSHPLYVEGRGWTEARDIAPGEMLLSDNGSVCVSAAESARPTRRVYNIEVGREHAYRISTSGIWAHNGCGETVGGGGKRWKVGDDPWNKTAKGTEPAWSTVRGRMWKNAAAAKGALEKWGAENLARMKRGLAPQRFNAEKGGMESMDLSHEPVPAREGGRNVVPRWPQDHAAIDSHRRPGY